MATTVNWPQGLPCFQSWQEQLEDNVLRTEMEVGQEKRRLRHTRQRRQITTQLTLKFHQYQALRTFYQADCLQGTISFNLTHPLEGTPIEVFFEVPVNYEAFNKYMVVVPLVLREA